MTVNELIAELQGLGDGQVDCGHMKVQIDP